MENEGKGEIYGPQDRVKVTYTVLRLNSEPVENATSRAMFAGHAANPMLTAVLKYMKPGSRRSSLFLTLRLMAFPVTRKPE